MTRSPSRAPRSPGRVGRPPKLERAPTPFGRWLDASGWSVAQFARLVDIDPRRVYRLRSGENAETIPLRVIEKILELAAGKLDLRAFRVD